MSTHDTQDTTAGQPVDEFVDSSQFDQALGLNETKRLSIKGTWVEFPDRLPAKVGAQLARARIEGPDSLRKLDTKQAKKLWNSVLGPDWPDRFAELGVNAELRDLIFQTLIAWHIGGREAALEFWNAGGKEPAPNRAERRKQSKTSRRTGSGNKTR